MYFPSSFFICHAAIWPWLAIPLFSMPRTQPVQLRLSVLDNTNAKFASRGLARLLSDNGIRYERFHFPYNNPTAIIVNFTSRHNKDQTLLISNLDTKLNRIKIKPITANSTNTNHRTIFVNNLDPCFFYYFTAEESEGTCNETLEMKKDELIADLKHTNEGQHIVNHHFIQLYNSDFSEKAPKTMKLTFDTVAHAEEFLKVDTITNSGPTIYKKNKRWNTNIPIRQCAVCKKTSHITGDASCDRIKRCYRCLSQDHTEPDKPDPHCNMRCWHCGDGNGHLRNHITTSAICPNNRRYAKEQRDAIRQRENINITPVDQRPMHVELVRLNNNFRRTQGLSYASAAGNTHTNSSANSNSVADNVPIANTNNNNPSNSATGSPHNTSLLKDTIMSAAFIAACKVESICPGKFQETMDNYYSVNGLLKIVHPLPPRAVINFYGNISDSSPIMQDDSSSHAAVIASVDDDRNSEPDSGHSASALPTHLSPSTVVNNPSHIDNILNVADDHVEEFSSLDSSSDLRETISQQVNHASPAMTRSYDTFNHTSVKLAISDSKNFPITIIVNKSAAQSVGLAKELHKSNLITVKRLIELRDAKKIEIKFNRTSSKGIRGDMLRFASKHNDLNIHKINYLLSQDTIDYCKSPGNYQPSRVLRS